MTIHLAITRIVKPGFEQEFKTRLCQFIRASMELDGITGVNMIEPPPGSKSREFGILRSFSDATARDAFYASPLFLAWKKESAVMTEGETEYRDLDGLEAFFSQQMRPPRWKMAVLTVLGVFPVSMILATWLRPHLSEWPRWAAFLTTSVVMVACLTWLVMPVLSKAFRFWLMPRRVDPS